jgi:hypothetical protein
MKYFYFAVCVILFSCKKTNETSELRLKTAKYYRNDSLIGQTDYSYALGNGLVEFETTKMNIGSFYSKHKYIFLNDSIEIDEDMYSGTDTARNQIMLYISGTNHLVSGIRVFSKPFDILVSERNYIYNVDQLSQVNLFTDKQTYDFSYNGANLTSYKVLVPQLLPPFGTDTLQFDLAYVSKDRQPAINFDLYLNPFIIPDIQATYLNIELTGAIFNTNSNLLLSGKVSYLDQVVPGGDPVTTYTYEFDNHGRVSKKSYKTETAAFPSSTTYRIVYEYL